MTIFPARMQAYIRSFQGDVFRYKVSRFTRKTMDTLKSKSARHKCGTAGLLLLTGWYLKNSITSVTKQSNFTFYGLCNEVDNFIEAEKNNQQSKTNHEKFHDIQDILEFLITKYPIPNARDSSFNEGKVSDSSTQYKPNELTKSDNTLYKAVKKMDNDLYRIRQKNDEIAFKKGQSKEQKLEQSYGAAVTFVFNHFLNTINYTSKYQQSTQHPEPQHPLDLDFNDFARDVSQKYADIGSYLFNKYITKKEDTARYDLVYTALLKALKICPSVVIGDTSDKTHPKDSSSPAQAISTKKMLVYSAIVTGKFGMAFRLCKDSDAELEQSQDDIKRSNQRLYPSLLSTFPLYFLLFPEDFSSRKSHLKEKAEEANILGVIYAWTVITKLGEYRYEKQLDIPEASDITEKLKKAKLCFYKAAVLYQDYIDSTEKKHVTKKDKDRLEGYWDNYNYVKDVDNSGTILKPFETVKFNIELNTFLLPRRGYGQISEKKG